MITLIILIVLVAIGGYLTTRWEYDVFGSIMCIIFGFWLIIHSVAWGISSYKYELFVEKRNAFEQTLKLARENGNEYEAAAVMKEIAQWNVELAETQYNNKIFYFEQYIDDRVELLEPIQ